MEPEKPENFFARYPNFFVLFSCGKNNIKVCVVLLAVELFDVLYSDTFYIVHFHYIPIVGVGKERRTLFGQWACLKRQHPLLLELP